MIVVVDERELVKDGYTSLFGREGVPSTGFDPKEFGEWVATAADTDIDAVEAFLIGQGETGYEPAPRDQGPVDGAGDRHQRFTLARKRRWHFLIVASMTWFASRFIRGKSSPARRRSAAA